MAASDSLKAYKAKRNFDITSEPADGGEASESGLAFVIQKHWATRLHYDFRLELDGSMKSWAVPKGPSFDSKDKRMAVHVEDHPISYNTFEGRDSGKTIRRRQGHHLGQRRMDTNRRSAQRLQGRQSQVRIARS